MDSWLGWYCYIGHCGLSLRLGSSESRKTPEKKFIFQIGTLNPHGTDERFSFEYIILVFLVAILLQSIAQDFGVLYPL